jgi:ubiquinone/menaquinone biosynthesis C-methylase UbiE
MIKRFLQNCRKPQGWIGRFVARSMNYGHATISRWGLSHLHAIDGEIHILDVGCGGGANLRNLLEMYPQAHISGIDYSEESVAITKKTNSPMIGRRCDVLRGSVSALPYENEKFAIATAFETIYFWPDIANDFREVRRVLKPDGVFLICVEACDPGKDIWTDKIDGMCIYAKDELIEILIDVGYTITEVDTNEKGWLCIVAHRRE